MDYRPKTTIIKSTPINLNEALRMLTPSVERHQEMTQNENKNQEDSDDGEEISNKLEVDDEENEYETGSRRKQFQFFEDANRIDEEEERRKTFSHLNTLYQELKREVDENNRKFDQ